jgi:hypothetical protein
MRGESQLLCREEILSATSSPLSLGSVLRYRDTDKKVWKNGLEAASDRKRNSLMYRERDECKQHGGSLSQAGPSPKCHQGNHP